MKNFFTTTHTLVAGLVLVSGLFSVAVAAQDEADIEERRARMEQRRAEFLENNPEAAARMEEQRREREAFRRDNPDVAARGQERLRERFENGEGRSPRGRQGVDGGRPGPGGIGSGPRFRNGPPARGSQDGSSTD